MSPPREFFIENIREVRERTRWLWPGRIPFGHLSLIGGRQDSGKSKILMNLSSRYINGIAWPDGQPMTCTGRVGLLDTEFIPTIHADRAEFMEIPNCRLVTLGDSKGEFYEVKTKEGREAFERRIVESKLKFVVIDSLHGAISGMREKEAESGGAFARWLHKIADATGAAIVGSAQVRKASEEDPNRRLVIDDIRGSSAITFFSRVVFLLDSAGGDTFQMRMVRSTLSGLASPLNYQHDDAGVIWGTPGQPAHTGERARAVGFLRDLLREGARPAREIMALASSQNPSISQRTLQRAKDDICVRTHQKSGVHWWSLPQAGAPVLRVIEGGEG